MASGNAQQRECASCSMCCKVLRINALSKPVLKWCDHCDVGKGCKIYQTKPEECTTFKCFWLLDEKLDDRFKPDKLKVVIYPHVDGYVIADCDQRGSMNDKRNMSLFFELARMVEDMHGKCLIVCHGNYMKAITKKRQVFDLGTTRETHNVGFARNKMTNEIERVFVVPLMQVR